MTSHVDIKLVPGSSLLGLLQKCQAQGGANGHHEHVEGNRRACVTQVGVTAAHSAVSITGLVAEILCSITGCLITARVDHCCSVAFLGPGP